MRIEIGNQFRAYLKLPRNFKNTINDNNLIFGTVSYEIATLYNQHEMAVNASY